MPRTGGASHRGRLRSLNLSRTSRSQTRTTMGSIGLARRMAMAAALTDRYAANLHGVLSCYDRIIITGTLPGACYAGGMTSYLYAHSIRIFDYPRFAEPLRDRIPVGIAHVPQGDAHRLTIADLHPGGVPQHMAIGHRALTGQGDGGAHFPAAIGARHHPLQHGAGTGPDVRKRHGQAQQGDPAFRVHDMGCSPRRGVPPSSEPYDIFRPPFQSARADTRRRNFLSGFVRRTGLHRQYGPPRRADHPHERRSRP